MYQPSEVLRALGRHHVRELNDYQQRLIAAICVGWAPPDIAAASGRSSKSVYRHIRELAAFWTRLDSSQPGTSFVLGPSCTEPAAARQRSK